MSKKTKGILAAVLLLVLVAVLIFVWKSNAPKAEAGGKALTIQVIHGDGSQKDFAFRTDAENLRAACEEQNLIQGSESDFGLYVLTVDGETADESQQQWWCITKGGEMLMTGVDDTQIADGEHYEIVLTTGW